MRVTRQTVAVERSGDRRRGADRKSTNAPGDLLTVDEAAEYLNTSVRFIRRLIAERRIAFVKLGRHVRLSTSDLDAFVSAGRVEPVTLAWSREKALA